MGTLSLGDLDKQFVATTDTYELYIADNHKGDPILFTVGRTGRPEHEKVARRYSKALERSRRNPDRHKKILIELTAKAILLDWSGLIDDTGKPVPCTEATRIEVLTKYPDIFSLVLETASDASFFRDEDEEAETEKN